MRFGNWLRFAIAVLFACAAAFAFFAYLSNGIVFGDLIGVPGRERAIAIAQDRANLSLFGFSVLQLGVAGTIFPGLRIGTESSFGARLTARALTAFLLSLPLTLSCGVLMIAILKWVR